MQNCSYFPFFPVVKKWFAVFRLNWCNVVWDDKSPSSWGCSKFIHIKGWDRDVQMYLSDLFLERLRRKPFFFSVNEEIKSYFLRLSSIFTFSGECAKYVLKATIHYMQISNISGAKWKAHLADRTSHTSHTSHTHNVDSSAHWAIFITTEGSEGKLPPRRLGPSLSRVKWAGMNDMISISCIDPRVKLVSGWN